MITLNILFLTTRKANGTDEYHTSSAGSMKHDKASLSNKSNYRKLDRIQIKNNQYPRHHSLRNLLRESSGSQGKVSRRKSNPGNKNLYSYQKLEDSLNAHQSNKKRFLG